MFAMSVDNIIDKVSRATNLPVEAIKGMINGKIEELSGLISEEGAAHIVANELGVKLLEISSSGFMDVKNLLPGLRNINISGIVNKVFSVRTFIKDGAEGKVGSFSVYDDTGEVRVVLWDHRVEMLENREITEGSKVSVRGAFVKEGLYGLEVHLRSTSELVSEKAHVSFTWIKDVSEGHVIVCGTVSDISAKSPFFKVCPQCGKKLTDVCPTHGNVTPAYSMVAELSIFDNTGPISCVCFGKRAESALQVECKAALELARSNNDSFLPIKIARQKLVGRTVYVSGEARVNSFTKKLEVVADDVVYPTPNDEISRMMAEWK